MMRFMTVVLRVCVITLAMTIRSFADDAKVEPKPPILIVRAATDILNQGKPTLDLQDLERYFVQELTERGTENVASFTTTKIFSRPEANVYIVELSVDALAIADRAGSFTKLNHRIFHVELSLAVKHAHTGRSYGQITERHEVELYGDDNTRRRAAIYGAAENLAQKFVVAASEGKFGSELALPLSSTLRSDWKKIISELPDWAPSGVLVIVGLILIVLLIAAISSSGAPRAPDVLPVSTTESHPPNHKSDFDERLNDVLALAIATSNFSEIECRRNAAAEREEVLKNAPAIEAAEAQRRLDLRARHAEYDKIAAYGTQFSWIEERSLWEMLGKADEWPFLVLQEAKKIQQEEDFYEQQS